MSFPKWYIRLDDRGPEMKHALSLLALTGLLTFMPAGRALAQEGKTATAAPSPAPRFLQASAMWIGWRPAVRFGPQRNQPPHPPRANRATSTNGSPCRKGTAWSLDAMLQGTAGLQPASRGWKDS